MAEEEKKETEAGESVQYGPEDTQILIVTDKGFAMKTTLNEFRVARRKTTGVQAMKLKQEEGEEDGKARGNVVATKKVKPGQLIFVATKKGIGALINADVVRLTGRKKAGVTLMKLEEDDCIVAVN